MLEQSSLLDEIRDMLLNSTLLNNFPPAEILSAARYFSINYVEKDEVIFGEGDMGTFMCLITEGTVSVQKSNQDGENIELARLHLADFIQRLAEKNDPRNTQNCRQGNTRDCCGTVAKTAHG
ncbi:MAG: cyclic nucleotide-binding domain-containing protein [Gallionellaceae bacterium]|jgi:CRP-like cAMP-binding protein